MKKILTYIATLMAAGLLVAPAHGILLGDNITIYDGDSSAGVWYGTNEDNEVEPGNARGDYWDLEGVFYDGALLSMVSSYNLAAPVIPDRQPGHLFIDVNGDAVFGAGAEGTGFNTTQFPNTLGYDYVIVMNYVTAKCSAYAIDGTATLESIIYSYNQTSNPWRYVTGGTPIAGYQDVDFTYITGLTSADVYGFLGPTHYVSRFDLSFLPSDTGFTTHATMHCGNDVLVGQVPDGGMTALLLGASLVAMVALYRRFGV